MVLGLNFAVNLVEIPFENVLQFIKPEVPYCNEAKKEVVDKLNQTLVNIVIELLIAYFVKIPLEFVQFFTIFFVYVSRLLIEVFY